MAYDSDLADRLRELVLHRDDTQEKRMFGGVAFLLHGHLAVAASGQGGLMVRCDPADLETHLGTGGEQMVMRGRELPGWLRVPADELDDDAALARWVDVALAFVATLPPK